MSKKTLGVTEQGWGALKKFAWGMATGDPISAAQELMSTPTDDEDNRDTAIPEEPEKHEPGSPSCGRKSDGYHCVAHNDEGLCVMVKDRHA